jgi:hypothetical protein
MARRPRSAGKCPFLSGSLPSRLPEGARRLAALTSAAETCGYPRTRLLSRFERFSLCPARPTTVMSQDFVDGCIEACSVVGCLGRGL